MSLIGYFALVIKDRHGCIRFFVDSFDLDREAIGSSSLRIEVIVTTINLKPQGGRLTRFEFHYCGLPIEMEVVFFLDIEGDVIKVDTRTGDYIERVSN